MRNHKTRLSVLVGASLVLSDVFVLQASPPGEQPVATEPAADAKRLTLVAAREHAKLMHNIYTATLDAMHHHYFHNNQAVVPARAMEDVFTEIAKQLNIKARWISVNTTAMSVHHEPRNEFEKLAAAEIAAGKDEFELVEDGYYRRATPIPLSGTCTSCHTGFFARSPKSPRFAGLIISVPINKE